MTPGKSSGDAMRAMEEVVAKLPKGIGFDWTGLSCRERMASSRAVFTIRPASLASVRFRRSWAGRKSLTGKKEGPDTIFL